MTPTQLAALATADYIEDLYRQYQRDPASVDPEWARYFGELAGAAAAAAAPAAKADETSDGTRVLGIFGLINTYRENGHLIANLDPLGHSPQRNPLLEMGEYGFTEDDLELTVHCGNYRGITT